MIQWHGIYFSNSDIGFEVQVVYIILLLILCVFFTVPYSSDWILLQSRPSSQVAASYSGEH